MDNFLNIWRPNTKTHLHKRWVCWKTPYATVKYGSNVGLVFPPKAPWNFLMCMASWALWNRTFWIKICWPRPKSWRFIFTGSFIKITTLEMWLNLQFTWHKINWKLVVCAEKKVYRRRPMMRVCKEKCLRFFLCVKYYWRRLSMSFWQRGVVQSTINCGKHLLFSFQVQSYSTEAYWMKELSSRTKSGKQYNQQCSNKTVHLIQISNI